MPKTPIVALILLAGSAAAEPPVIEAVTATQSGGVWRFDVTVRHPDTGWDHYADAWEVVDPEGRSLGLRELLHPHEQEQPFTRSLSGVAIPDGFDMVGVRARCSVDGWSGEVFPVSLR